MGKTGLIIDGYSIEDIQGVFLVEIYDKKSSDYLEFLRDFGGSLESLVNRFDLGVSEKNFTSHFRHRTSSTGRKQRKLIKELGISGEKGAVTKVGLTFPLYSGAGKLVNFCFYRLRGGGSTEDRTSDLGKDGMIWKTDSREVILVDHPLDLVALKACGYENGVYAADLTCSDFKEKLGQVDKITLIHNNLPELDGLAVHKMYVERLNGSFLWEHLRGNPHAETELESFLLVAPRIAGEAKPVAKKNPTWRKENGFYFADLEERTYRIGGLEANKNISALRVTLRVIDGEERSFTDTLDLYKDGNRKRWITRCSDELEMNQDDVKQELGQVTLLAEQIQYERNDHKESPRYELSPDEEKAAKSYLESEKLFDSLKDDLALLGLDGKEALAAYLACTSRLTNKPLNLTSPCPSFIEAMTALFPPELAHVQGQLSPKALYYIGDQGLENSILAITGGKLTEEVAALLKNGSLKALTVETDKELNAPRAKSRTIDAAPMFFLNQNAVDDETKALCLNLRSSKAADSLQSRSEEGFLAQSRCEEVRRKHQNLQRFLRKLPIINDFAEKLEFSSPRSMSRELYLRLIDAVCLLRQCQKELDHLESGVAVLRVDADDIRIANELAKDLFKSYELDDLPANLREKFTALCADLTKRKQKTFTRSDYRRITGCGLGTSKNHLDRLLSAELVFGKKQQGKETAYTLGIEYPFKAESIRLTAADSLAA